jgi:hypothetical protein
MIDSEHLLAATLESRRNQAVWRDLFMNTTSPFFTTLAVSNIVLWVLAGLMTIGSNYYGFNIANFIVGFIFFLIGYFWYVRYNNTVNLITELKKSNILNISIEAVLHRTVNLELILIFIGLLIVLIVNSGVVSRVFSEKMSVFG